MLGDMAPGIEIENIQNTSLGLYRYRNFLGICILISGMYMGMVHIKLTPCLSKYHAMKRFSLLN